MGSTVKRSTIKGGKPILNSLQILFQMISNLMFFFMRNSGILNSIWDIKQHPIIYRSKLYQIHKVNKWHLPISHANSCEQFVVFEESDSFHKYTVQTSTIDKTMFATIKAANELLSSWFMEELHTPLRAYWNSAYFSVWSKGLVLRTKGQSNDNANLWM